MYPAAAALQMMMGGAGPPVVITETATPQSSTSTLTTLTYTDAAIGAAAAARIVWVAVAVRGFGGASRTISSVTIGGVPANLVASASSPNPTAIAWLLVPSGTTATCVVTCSGDTSRSVVFVGTAVPPGSSTAIDSDHTITAASTSTGRELSLTPGSAGLWVSSWETTNDTTWVNASELNDTTPGSVLRASIAKYETAITENRTATASNSSAANSMCAVAWR